MKRHWKKSLVGFGILLLVALAVVKVIDIKERPARVASILNIPSLPNSVRVIDCKAALIPTDFVDTCSIEIDPKDFPKILRGYAFKELPATGTSHSAVSTRVGPEFPITTDFIAEPKEFKYGGSVQVLTDSERKRAVIDLYIE